MGLRVLGFGFKGLGHNGSKSAKRDQKDSAQWGLWGCIGAFIVRIGLWWYIIYSAVAGGCAEILLPIAQTYIVVSEHWGYLILVSL